MSNNSPAKNVHGQSIDAFADDVGVANFRCALSLFLLFALLLPPRSAFSKYTGVTGKLGHVRRDKGRFTVNTRARCPCGNLSRAQRCQPGGFFRKWKCAETNSRPAGITRLRVFFFSETHPRRTATLSARERNGEECGRHKSPSSSSSSR